MTKILLFRLFSYVPPVFHPNPQTHFSFISSFMHSSYHRFYLWWLINTLIEVKPYNIRWLVKKFCLNVIAEKFDAFVKRLDSRFRRNDGKRYFWTFYEAIKFY